MENYSDHQKMVVADFIRNQMIELNILMITLNCPIKVYIVPNEDSTNWKEWSQHFHPKTDEV